MPTKAELEGELRDMNFKLQHYAWLEEELERFDKYIERLKSEEHGLRLASGRSRIEQVMGATGHFRHQRDSAFRVLGAMVEHTLISLRAIHMVAKSTYGMTHRQKNVRMDVLCDTIEEAIRILIKDRDRGPEYFEHEYFARKDWDFRRLAGENHRLYREITELKEKLKTQEDAIPQEDEIPF